MNEKLTECKPIEADGDPPLICQGHRWQISSPSRCYCCRGDSYDDNSVAADQSNLCGQRSIDAAAAADDDGRSEDEDTQRGDRRATGAVKRREGDCRRDDDDDYGRTRQRRRRSGR
jgi:hypothetical protein